MKRHESKAIKEAIVKEIVEEIRQNNPEMGLRKIHTRLNPKGIGRDEFIRIGMNNGLGISPMRCFHKTTYSDGSRYFPNLTGDLVINDINQVWCSDITYFRVKDVFYYITLVQDVYDRSIVGWHVHEDLKTIANCIALQKAFKTRNCSDFGGKLIHHSDRGCQYTSYQYTGMLNDAGIRISTCNSVYENAFVERLNGIIKNEYLRQMNITGLSELKKALDKAVESYNNERPHMKLNYMTPVEYAEYISSISLDERPSFKMYKEPRIFVN